MLVLISSIFRALNGALLAVSSPQINKYLIISPHNGGMRILLIEDNSDVARSLRRSLTPDHDVRLSGLGQEALALLQSDEFDVIILDLDLPDISGLEVCRRLRRSGINTAVLILTGNMEPDQKVTLLDAGADDYLTKPFHLAELTARLRALERRSSQGVAAHKVLAVDDLVLDVTSRQVTRHNQEIPLRRKEFELLEYLMRNRGQAVARSRILDHVWGQDSDMWTNAIDVHIKYLRDKIDRPFGKKLIKTVHGVGYKIDAGP